MESLDLRVLFSLWVVATIINTITGIVARYPDEPIRKVQVLFALDLLGLTILQWTSNSIVPSVGVLLINGIILIPDKHTKQLKGSLKIAMYSLRLLVAICHGVLILAVAFNFHVSIFGYVCVALTWLNCGIPIVAQVGLPGLNNGRLSMSQIVIRATIAIKMFCWVIFVVKVALQVY